MAPNLYLVRRLALAPDSPSIAGDPRQYSTD